MTIVYILNNVLTVAMFVFSLLGFHFQVLYYCYDRMQNANAPILYEE